MVNCNFTATLLLAVFFSSILADNRSDDKNSVLELIRDRGGHLDFCVIGAGPAGVQMGQHLSEAGASYVVLEKSHAPGAFFEKFPIHGQLISINKKATGGSNPEFNLRTFLHICWTHLVNSYLIVCSIITLF